MSIKKIFIAHSWTDVGINIQTKLAAEKISEIAKVTFFSQARIGKPELVINDHLKVIEWPNKRPNSFKDFYFLFRQIRKEKPEVIIVHFGATNLCMAASWLMRVKYRVCWMHTLSGQFYLDSQKKTAAKLAIFVRSFAYWLATHVIVLNEYGRMDAIEHFNVKPKKIFKIYNGLLDTKFKAVSDKSRVSIRFSGRLDKSKGIDILIKAFSNVYRHNKNIVLEIAGKGSEEENIQALIKQEGLSTAVKMHGYFNQYTEALKFISAAHFIVVPSRMDNFPTTILEAMSYGIPVIATAVGGIPDMIENGKEGLLVKAESIEALAEAISGMINNEALRDRMAIQAKNTFDEKFSMETHINNVVKFIDNLKS